MGIQYNQANNITTTLNGAINNSVISITVTSSTGFPATPFVVIIDTELLLVTNVSGTTWTVTRGSESTTAASHLTGSIVRQVASKAAWDALVQLQTGATTAQTGAVNIDGALTTGGLITAGSTSTAGSAGAFFNQDNVKASIRYQNTGTNDGVSGTAVGNGVVGDTTGTTTYGVKGTQSGSAGTGAAGRFEGGSNIGGDFTNSSATLPTVKAANSTAGLVFAGYSGATLTSEINTDGTANLYVAPNYVMNGNMLVNQRLGPGGTLAIATGAQTKYGLDRFRLDKDGTSQGTLGQQAFTLGQTAVPFEPIYYLDWNITTGGASATKNNLEHYIEDVRTLAGKQVTFSFWGKVAASTQSVTPEIEQNFGSGGSPSSVVLATSGAKTFTTTWQQFSYTVTLGSLSGKTIGTTANTSALVIRLKCPLNTACQISTTQWQVEPGPIVTPFRLEPINETLSKCYRYYNKSFPYATAPAQNAGRTGEILVATIKAGATAQNLPQVQFYSPMRVAPTMTYYNPGATNAFAHVYGTGNADCTTTTTGFSSEKNVVVQVTPTSAAIVADPVGYHYQAAGDFGD